MENLNEGMGGSIENEFQDWLDIMLSEKGYEDEIETLETVIDYAQDTLRDYSIDNWVPQTGGSTNENRKMKDFDLKKYLAEGKLLKEDNLRDYWSEWAAGEIEVGNDTVGVEFGDADDEAMGVFKDYVKAVKSLNADSKELRNDIAGAVSSILYDGGDFEDYTFDVLTADQYTKIQDII